jgi:hypothetical protein
MPVASNLNVERPGQTIANLAVVRIGAEGQVRFGAGGSAGPVGAGATITVPVTGHGGVPASGVAGVVVNLTITEPAARGYVTAWPVGPARPLASSANVDRSGQTIANLVMIPVGTARRRHRGGRRCACQRDQRGRARSRGRTGCPRPVDSSR